MQALIDDDAIAHMHYPERQILERSLYEDEISRLLKVVPPIVEQLWQGHIEPAGCCDGLKRAAERLLERIDRHRHDDIEDVMDASGLVFFFGSFVQTYALAVLTPMYLLDFDEKKLRMLPTSQEEAAFAAAQAERVLDSYNSGNQPKYLRADRKLHKSIFSLLEFVRELPATPDRAMLLGNSLGALSIKSRQEHIAHRSALYRAAHAGKRPN